ncbi:MAG: family 43 glycosylhydrolase [Kiritimatiellae bacterium]|nr:family 43 glycosylhydrolase [Kiritimatiellia bacterium]
MKNLNTMSAALVAVLFAGEASAAMDGTNPIVKDRFTPDPAAVADGDWLYVFTGHDDPHARGYKMKDWQVFGTTNMTDWVDFGAVMDTSVFKWARQGDRAWASQAIKRGGKWYWYVAVQQAGGGDAIGVATADDIKGPWTDAAGKPMCTGRGFIDPSVMIDDDGKAWLFWGNCGGDPGCWYGELKDNMFEFADGYRPVPGLMDEKAFGKPIKKARGAGAYKKIDSNFEEAPWIYKAGDTYYLEYAAGGVPEYWAYSTAKSIHGPWTYGGRIMDEAENTGTIHGGSVFFKGEWYMVYHNAILPDGADCRRSFCIERYERNEDGSIPFIHQTKGGVSKAGTLEPTLWADVPDISMCRKGNKYYMVSTTMHFNPGMPVMVSEDLADWKIASYCYPTIENRPKDRLENGENDYLFGTWAASIRYSEEDDRLYVTGFNNKVDSTYFFTCKDPEKGDWAFRRLSPKQYDESLWVENGRFWVYATVPGKPYKVRLTEMNKDFSGFVDGGKIVLGNVTDVFGARGGLGEGTQVFKRGDWYYLVNICWPKPKCRTVVVHRSKNMDGPWEGKVVYQHEGIAQGSFMESAEGKWFAYLFGDRGAVGRCPYMLPVEWEDGWPVVSKVNIPRKAGIPAIVESDEFTGDGLKSVWQWNHNPADGLWSLSSRPGWLVLSTGRTDADLSTARNTLTQRTWGPACRAVTKVDVSSMKDGDKAGLALFQRDYASLSAVKEGENFAVVLEAAKKGKAAELARARLPKGVREVWLKATGDFSRLPGESFKENPPGADEGRFFWSEDGNVWHPVGRSVKLVYTIPHFTGYRFALFNYSTKNPGGHADFDFLRLD